MLTITIPQGEMFDEVNERFIRSESVTIDLEHSLVSISKWEQKWHKPYLNNDEPRTAEEAIDYVRCMTLTPNVDPNAYYFLTEDNYHEIKRYIDDKRTATIVHNDDSKDNDGTFITNELIYYWMIANQIPVEFENWHLNRLLTLINVCAIKNAPPKKMSAEQTAAYHKAKNAERRAKYGQ